MSGTIFAVDGTNQMHRYWHGAKELAATVFLDMLDAIQENFHPQEIVCAFDSADKTFRHELEPTYKSGRSEKEQGLLEQMQLGIDGLVSKGIIALSVSGFEADDILATIALKCHDVGNRLVLVTSDKDCRQLLSSECAMLVSYRKHEQGYVPEWFNEARLREKYGVSPSQWVDWQMIVGDSTDSIRGVEGIGEKGASKLLGSSGSYDVVANTLWGTGLSEKKRRAFERFRNREDTVRKLVTLRRDVPINWEP